MNKLASSILALIIITLLAPPVSAADSTSPTPDATTREIIKDNREKILEAREVFKTKLRTIKDTKKQTIIERIDARLPEINTRRTNQMSQALSRLSTILEREALRISTLTPAPTIDPTLTVARAAIITSQEAVAIQTDKEYVITLGLDTALRPAVLATITALKTDLKTTHEAVIAARAVVVTALKAMAPSQSTTTPDGGAN